MNGLRSLFVGLIAVLALVAVVALPGCGGKSSAGSAGSQESAVASEAAQPSSASEKESSATDESSGSAAIDENGTYTSKEEVALYLHTYGHLPSNYITKDEAEDAGWKSNGKSLDEACPGMSIGGDRFGNREGLLPKASGRTYQECDIDYKRGNRNAKRIVYSNDGLIFYTEDHYESFEQLY